MKAVQGVLSVLLLVAVSGIGALSIGGCNTTKGAGKDIENVGEGIHDAAGDVENQFD